MNKAIIMVLAVLSLPAMAQAAISLTALECIPSTGHRSRDITIAKAKAKGQLARDLEGLTSSSQMLVQISEEGPDGIEQKDRLTEKTTITANVLLSRVRTVASYYENINGQNHYCIELKI